MPEICCDHLFARLHWLLHTFYLSAAPQIETVLLFNVCIHVFSVNQVFKLLLQYAPICLPQC